MQPLRNINAKELAGLMTIVAVFVFTGFAMWVEPTGEIHNSVIGLNGELLFFSGTCFGLDYFAHRSTNKSKSNDNGHKEDKAQ